VNGLNKIMEELAEPPVGFAATIGKGLRMSMETNI